MGKRPKHLDDLLKDWPYEFGEVAAREVIGHDGRELIQLRIDMGVLQMETTGRPDGEEPGGIAAPSGRAVEKPGAQSHAAEEPRQHRQDPQGLASQSDR